MLKYLLLLFCLYLLSCENNSSDTLTDDPSTKMFSVRKMKTPRWVNNTGLYVVDIRRYTPEGTFAAFAKHLPRLKKMGVQTILLRPIFPIGFEKRDGHLGNLNAVADHTKVNPELGSFEDLKSLISDIHRLHLHALMDWVSDHTAWDHSWKQSQSDWYMRRDDTISHPHLNDGQPSNWFDVAELDYSQGAMRNTMIESMKFWLRSIDIDGFRCLDADLVPDEFWDAVRPALETVKPVFMVADARDNANHFETCFQANDGGNYYEILQKIMSGDATMHDLHQTISQDRARFPLGYYHTMIAVPPFGSRVPKQEELRAQDKALIVASHMMEGISIVYGGEEIGKSSHNPINWANHPDLETFYTKLIQLKQHNKALWNGIHGGTLQSVASHPQVFAFLRSHDDNTVVTLVNCSDQEVTLELESNLRALTDLFTVKDYTLKEGQSITLSPWQYLVLSNPSILL